MTDLVTPVPTGKPTFAGLPRCEDIASLDAHIAIIGVPYGIPASMEASRAPSSEAPDAIRAESLRFGKYFDHHDIDLGGPILAGRDIRVVDCGDVSMRPGDNAANSATTTEAIRAIRAAGAVPFILGGDHSIPIPVMRAYDDIGTMCVVQFDAHLDYRDEVNGVKEGLSSSIRRASELDYVGDIVQIGLRGLGSARDQDVQDAMDRRNIFITAAEMYKNGLDEVTKRLPQADNYYITFDMDVMDPSIAPGVNSPAFGGIDYWQATGLLWAVARRGRIVGLDMVEIAPRVDTRGLTSMLAARLMLNLLGAMTRSGQLG
ncbi:MAG TPA: agmatinase [Thermomicrobiales bacterium]|jgi:agmatinase|nr:agmatinase [Thermomicrobiales bacterium]